MKNNKSLGQHWLKNRGILEEIAELAAFGVNSSADKSSEKKVTCLEIGPGLGSLTSSLLKRFSKVIAIEFDERLANNLPKSFPGKNLEVINEDILKFNFSTINENYVIAGNIPYYITSPIIEKILTLEKKPKRIVLLIQREVAERITNHKETLLSLFVKNNAEIFLGPIVKKEDFTPPPKIDSRVIVLEPRKPIIKTEVFDLIKIGFSAPRKKLIHNLARICPKEKLVRVFDELKIDLNSRPGDLKLKDWAKLYLMV